MTKAAAPGLEAADVEALEPKCVGDLKEGAEPKKPTSGAGTAGPKQAKDRADVVRPMQTGSSTKGAGPIRATPCENEEEPIV